jgi:phosphate-selective porin OprO and OprP
MPRRCQLHPSAVPAVPAAVVLWCIAAVAGAQPAAGQAQDPAIEEDSPVDWADEPSRSSQARGQAVYAPDVPPPGLRAEYGRGVSFTSEDGRFSLTMRGRLQTRATVTENLDTDDVDISFMIRRARLVFLGHLFTHDLQYYVQLSFAPLDLEPDQNLVVRDAVITWARWRDLGIRVGQTKVPFNRERVISSSALQLVDRSIVNAELNLDRDMGFYIFSEDFLGLDGLLGYQLSVSGGDGRNRPNTGTSLLYVARLELRPLGAFHPADAYSEADISRSPRPRLSIGAGAGYNQGSQRALSTHGTFFEESSFDHIHGEVDLIYKQAGFSLQAEILYRQARQDAQTVLVDGEEVTDVARSGFGYMVQAGYVFPSHFEVAARWAEILPTHRFDTALTRWRELTVGSSYYALAHNLKVQMDYGYLFGEALGAGHHMARLQMQVFY